MADQAADETSKTEPVVAELERTCGIVMPISAIEPSYTADHWLRVRKVFERAVAAAKMTSQLVWENAAIDVIQSKILKNIYETDVIICDVSGLNPNVMLELGLRLSTKRPTIIVTDALERPPFDINVVEYLSYPADLEYNATDSFIRQLAQRLRDVDREFREGTYVSFVANFSFETVAPRNVEVSENEFLANQVSALAQSVQRLERMERREPVTKSQPSPPRTLEFTGWGDISNIKAIREALEWDDDLRLVDFTIFPGSSKYVLYVATGKLTNADARLRMQKVIDDNSADDDIPF